MRIPFLFLSALATLSLVSCGNSGPKGAAIRDGDVVFTKTPYADLSALPERLNLEVEVTGKITRLQVGTQVLLSENSGKYSYAKGILTIDTSAFKDKDGELLIGPGDQPIRIYADTTVTTSCLFVSKVLKTAEDLVAINQGGSAALQGAYILGNDIDCSSIANFEPLGYSDTDDGTHYNEQFNGIFDGNGYSIKNVTTKYSNNPASYKEIFDGNYQFEDEAHKTGNKYGFFQEIGGAGVVRNVAFDNVSITGRTIVGIVAGLNSGRIENVLVKENCRALMSTHFYDETCALGGIAGVISSSDTAIVEHCLSLATDLNIVETYVDYDEEAYYEEDHGITHTFYNGELGWDDSNGKRANNIYSGVGLTYGVASENLGKLFNVTPTGLPADFSQTHIEANKEKDGPDCGMLTDCDMLSVTELKTVAPYEAHNFDTSVWNLKEGVLPSFKAVYPSRIYKA